MFRISLCMIACPMYKDELGWFSCYHLFSENHRLFCTSCGFDSCTMHMVVFIFLEACFASNLSLLFNAGQMLHDAHAS